MSEVELALPLRHRFAKELVEETFSDTPSRFCKAPARSGRARWYVRSWRVVRRRSSAWIPHLRTTQPRRTRTGSSGRAPGCWVSMRWVQVVVGDRFEEVTELVWGPCSGVWPAGLRELDELRRVVGRIECFPASHCSRYSATVRVCVSAMAESSLFSMSFNASSASRFVRNPDFVMSRLGHVQTHGVQHPKLRRHALLALLDTRRGRAVNTPQRCYPTLDRSAPAPCCLPR